MILFTLFFFSKMKTLVLLSCLSLVFAIPNINQAKPEYNFVLPDGLFPDDVVHAASVQSDSVVPMIVMDEKDLPAPSVQPNLHRNQVSQGYKHMGMGNGYIKIAPLMPDVQYDLSLQRQQWAHSLLDKDESKPGDTPGRKYKQLVGMSDKGQTQKVNVPAYENKSVVASLAHKLSQEIEKIYPEGVSEQRMVGVDQHGMMRYLNIPHYSRMANPHK
ncbi:uncharacterized protein B0P05DRAFT_574331 [Gilbertella persicaria]|uniref:Uncharacterized protein n=1 Tax=Rhizopus stolonifer TaxID=4846 RepID=A0A367JSJ3_RHIST|nr:uncharacterized protein B0P05DRAFT_574331 [Gilbertella persicaria]KAI8063407.1 hypothetical protein B0P05DRAFT_574331 [Gilbertella persicaria]RCH92907.1 hypothetical protein CU098_010296 [Rhizopus stolonifer]